MVLRWQGKQDHAELGFCAPPGVSFVLHRQGERANK